MRIDVFTIFPAMVEAFAAESLLGRAVERGLLDIRVHDLRDGTTDAHRSVDDTPYGGGAGMVFKPAPVFAAVEAVAPPRPLYYLGPAGRRLDQTFAEELAETADARVDGSVPTGDAENAAGPAGFSLLCGRYEGIDERIRTHLVDGEISIGDYVLAGGEVAAMVVLEAVGRLIPGVMGNESSAGDESFSTTTGGLLEYPHYTKPATFRDLAVPDILRSGDHARIARWRQAQAIHRTVSRRPDLIDAQGGLTPAQRSLMVEFPAVEGASAAEPTSPTTSTGSGSPPPPPSARPPGPPPSG